MGPNFNIDRPKVSDEEINSHKDFDKLVKQFKERSLKQAQGDESWWKNKKVQYSTVITGVTVICTISYFALFKNNKQKQNTNETLITSNSPLLKNKKIAKPFINAPSQKLAIPYSTYSVNNASGADINHPSNSKIKIPKNSFIDKQGKDIIGDITLEYREFHDAGDIIASGIPMAYDSAKTHYNLESAGMFEIKGSQDGEPVFIKPDKQIEVVLASTNEENRFNQYFLDTVSKNWKYIQKDIVHKIPSAAKKNVVHSTNKTEAGNPKLLALKNQLDLVIPKKIDSVKTIYFKKAQQLARAIEPLKPAQPTKGRPTFKLDGSYKEFPELSAFDNVVFEVGPENKNYTQELHEITWSDVKVTQGPVKGKNYVLNLSYRNRSEKLIVYPVLLGTDFEKAQKTYEIMFSDYEALVEKRKDSEQKLLAEMQAKQEGYMADLKKKQIDYELEKAKFLQAQETNLVSNFNTMGNTARASRLFSVSQFGIYNSDCPHSMPSGISVNPIFVLDDKGSFLIPDQVYLVDHTKRSVYNLDAQSGFKIATGEGVFSVCIFKQNKMYLCSKEQFQQAIANGGNKFVIKILQEESENLVDFKKALEI